MSSMLTIIWEKYDLGPNSIPSTDRDVLRKPDFSGYPSFNSEELIFYPVTRIYSDGMERDVYRGILQCGDNQMQYDAALKVRFGDARDYGRGEAENYCLPEIQRVQGKLIPRFYGFFEGEMETYETKTSCLVLEYVGEQIYPIEDTLKLRFRVFDQLCELHKEGVKHGLLTFLDHVCQHPDGRVVFTNLCGVSVNHDCPSARHPAAPGEQYAPARQKYLCSQLINCLVRLRIWTPVSFSCYDHQVKSDYAYPKPKLHDLVENEAPKDIPRLEAEKEGCEAIMEYLKKHQPKTYKKYEEELVNTLLRIEYEEDEITLRKIRSRKLKKARSTTPTQPRSRSLTPTPETVHRN
ncbi:hypothetical protein ABKN59_002823 [Abortiporus biennis]